jgi:stage V sporulation protein S
MDVILKVSSQSNPNLVAGALVGTIKESGRAQLQTIGAGAINQAVKAVAIARNMLGQSQPDIDLVCIPSFADITIDEQIRTSIRLVVEPR